MKNNYTNYSLYLLKNFIIPLAFIFSIANTYAQPALTLTPVITSGLSEPLQLVNAGDGSNRIFIVQKGGTILVYSASYSFISTFLTVTNITTSGERGLLSMVFHPAYASNGFFYVYYTAANGDLEVARYHVSANADVADANSKVVVITIPHSTNTNHNGGEMHFGSDGFLYLSTGDGGGSGDVPNNAQNTSVLLGKMLRLNVNTSLTAPYYTIPAGNPYGNEIYHLGLRNPFRWSFDRQTNDMWIGDVGQNSWEEIDFIAAGTSPGINLGWRCYEGNATFNTTGCGSMSNYAFPVYTYPTPSPGAVTGGIVYRGAAYQAMQGWYLSADFYTGEFFKIASDGSGGWITGTQTLAPIGIADFGETENGEAYVVSLIDNSVHLIGASGGVGIQGSNAAPKMMSPVVSNGELSLDLPIHSEYQLLEIINTNGTVVTKEIFTGSKRKMQLPVNHLSPGVYLLRLSGDGNNYVHKISIP